MTTPTQGEHAQTEALRPKFGDLLRNTMASESNPRRDAYFIREVHRSGGGVNPGRWFEMTDGKGETWLSNPQNMVPAATAQPAAPQGVAYADAHGAIMGAAYDFRDAHISGSPNQKRSAHAALESAVTHALRASNGQAPAGDEQKALAALHYYKTECSGTEPSISVFHRMVDDALEAAPADGAVAGPTSAHIAAMERAWLWMDNQADSQSKGGHATFDLLMLREERDALRAAIDMEVTATCPHCNGAGEVFGHAENCTDDLCALNGDDHSCAGQVEPCQCAATPTPAAQADRVLEDAARWQAVEAMVEDVSGGDGYMVIVMTRNAKPEPFLQRFLADKIDVMRAARKQGAKHD